MDYELEWIIHHAIHQYMRVFHEIELIPLKSWNEVICSVLTWLPQNNRKGCKHFGALVVCGRSRSGMIHAQTYPNFRAKLLARNAQSFLILSWVRYGLIIHDPISSLGVGLSLDSPYWYHKTHGWIMSN